jgi:predicted SnoaL-like aldol condensation-catalyzing enzyme
MGDTGNALVDIYRVNDNGKIAEHWDVIIQQIPKNSANNNTMFYLD